MVAPMDRALAEIPSACLSARMPSAFLVESHQIVDLE